MMKKNIFLILFTAFCAVLPASANDVAPDLELSFKSSTATVNPQIMRSPFFPDKERKAQSQFSLQALGKYTRDLSTHERKQLLKVAATFSGVEAVTAAYSCAKVHNSYMLKGLLGFRALRALTNMYLALSSLNNFEQRDEETTADSEAHRRDSATAQYEVAWQVAGTKADSPLFERIRQESYNFGNQPRDGLERLKPLVPVIYPLSSGALGVVTDLLKVWQSRRSEPLIADYEKETEQLILELISLVFHTYSSGNMLEMLPASVKKGFMTQAVNGTHSISVIVTGLLLIKSIIKSHGHEYRAWCEAFQKTTALKHKLSGLFNEDEPGHPVNFDAELQDYFEQGTNPPTFTFDAATDKAPRCEHCLERITPEDDFIFNKENPQRVIHVHGHIDGHACLCFADMLENNSAKLVHLQKKWVFQKTKKRGHTFSSSDYARLKKVYKFDALYKTAQTANAVLKAIEETQPAIKFSSLPAEEQQAFRDKFNNLKCPICLDECDCAGSDFMIASGSPNVYHSSCLAEQWAKMRPPFDSITKRSVLDRWSQWYRYTQDEPDEDGPHHTRAEPSESTGSV